MHLEGLGNIIKYTDIAIENIEKCIRGGIEFFALDEKSDGLMLNLHKDKGGSCITVAPTYNNNPVRLNNKSFIYTNLYDHELERYYIEFSYGAKYENGVFLYRIAILKIDKETDKFVDGFTFLASFKEYEKYLLTQVWESKRKEKLKEARYRCQLCGAKEVELHVHHNNYDNLCYEEMNDLAVLCKRCHEKFHGIE